MMHPQTPTTDTALLASVPHTALSHGRVQKAARRLARLALGMEPAGGSARSSEVQDFRRLCKTLLTKGRLPAEDASRLQRYASMIHDDLCRGLLRI